MLDIIFFQKVRSWFSQLKGFDSKIPQHVGKGAKKIVIHHDGDEDGSVEKFEININDPAGNAETGVVFAIFNQIN